MMLRRARKNRCLLYLTSASFREQHIPVVPLLDVSVRLGFALTFAHGQTIDSTFPGSSRVTRHLYQATELSSLLLTAQPTLQTFTAVTVRCLSPRQGICYHVFRN